MYTLIYGKFTRTIQKGEIKMETQENKIGNPDALIIFTNKISHEAKRKAVRFARSRNIPLQLIHSCGVSSLRECLPDDNGR